MTDQSGPSAADIAAIKANYALSDDQRAILDHVERVAREVLHPLQEKMDAEEYWPEDLFPKMGERGLLGITAPVELGGSGQDEFTQALVSEVLSKWNPAVGLSHGAHDNLCINNIYRNASEEMRRKYLPGLCDGSLIGALGLTEPGAGSDALGSMKTTARKDGDEYVLNGTKIFISNAGEAQTYVVTMKTRPSRGARGMSAFIVEKDTPGFSFGKQEDKLCFHALANRELIFQDCRIPAENLLGKENRGFRVAMDTLDVGRIGMSVGAIGLAKAAMEKALQYSKDRIQCGQRIANFQAIQHKLADMATEIEAAELLMLKATWLRDQGRPFGQIAAMSKLYSSEVCNRVTNQAVQIHGGYGLMREYSVERYLRESKLFEIVEGTSEIQRNVIAGHILK